MTEPSAGPAPGSLHARLPDPGASGSGEVEADQLYDALVGWAGDQGLDLYPHQDEALIELLSGSNVILSTPTGSGKSLVATGAMFAMMARHRVTIYTAPIKALVSEKFFALCEVFGAANVGMMTGDASVNADAPVICCTAEVLANLALRQGTHAAVDMVVMDEFHFYADPERGWAWQVPLLELPHAQFLLMSATLGPVQHFADDLTARTGRETAVVAEAERPVPLTFTWATTPLHETVEELVSTGQAPVYVVHFTQAAAVEHATALRSTVVADRDKKEAIAAVVGGFRFSAGFGKTLAGLVRNGIGVHHAGMLPRYRRLVEQLAQRGLLTVICGTDTLGVGINVPIRTVLFSGLAKFDGTRQRVLRIREFQQIAGRAGRAGFDPVGHVVVQAPPHVIENERALAKAGDDPKKRRKVQRKKPPEGTVVWTEQTFEKLVGGEPEPLTSRMRVDNAMIVNVAARHEDAFPVMRRLVRDNHEEPRAQLRLARRALQLARSLLASGVLTRLEEPDEHGRRYVLTVDLPDDFALNQPLAHFALAALDLLDPESPDHAADVVSVVEAVIEPPRQVLWAQQRAARDSLIAELKADGVEYEERMARMEEVTWPRPLAELLTAAYETYRQSHPWLPEDALEPKSVVREMYEQGMTFTEFAARYRLARSEGLLLRYLTDAYRTLRRTVPEGHRTPELETITEWLGETVRQTDSSLLDEWEALSDPEHLDERLRESGAPPPPRPLSQQERSLTVMVRNAMFRRVLLAARDDVQGLAELEAAALARLEEGAGDAPGAGGASGAPESPETPDALDADGWDRALEAYFAEHDTLGTGPDARGPDLFEVRRGDAARPGAWEVRQTLADPAGHRDWVIEAMLDLAATDAAGEPVLWCTAMRRLGG